eukprot:NODE_21_length_42443_cov_0.822808.p32 type:complete len:149 gc:universal NODE_21_length_42443_cov_0.822808:15815-15369(-)
MAYLVTSVLSLGDLIQFKRYNLYLMSDLWFLVIYNILLSVLGRLSGMPLLIYCATVCPSPIANSLYAFMMSWINTTSDVGSFIGSWLLDRYHITPHQFEGLEKLIILRSLLLFIPLLGLSLLPKEQAVPDELEALIGPEDKSDEKVEF